MFGNVAACFVVLSFHRGGKKILAGFAERVPQILKLRTRTKLPRAFWKYSSILKNIRGVLDMVTCGFQIGPRGAPLGRASGPGTGEHPVSLSFTN